MATAGAIPHHSPAPLPGYEYYLYELQDFQAEDGSLKVDACQALVRCLARFSTDYWCSRTANRQEIREGKLPRSAAAKERFVEELFSWFQAPPDFGGFSAHMSLKAGDTWLMDAHDGFPGPLHLKPRQYRAVQQALVSAGLAEDTYYPVSRRRLIIEPVRWSDMWPTHKVVNGVLMTPKLQPFSTTDFRWHSVVDLEGELPAIIDSDRALEIANESFGNEFCARHHAQLVSLLLCPSAEGKPLWEVRYGRTFPHVSLRLLFDAYTGEVAAREEKQETYVGGIQIGRDIPPD